MAPRVARSLRILVADDDPIARTVLRSMLRKLGHSTAEVGDGQAVLDAVAASAFDALVLDLRMPGLGGIETAQRLRASGSTVPIMGTSARLERDEEARCRAAGMRGFLPKPVPIEELRHRLAEALEPPPIDRAALLRQHGGDEGLARDVLAQFLPEARQLGERLQAAVRARDAAALAALAHRLAGSLAWMGAGEAAQTAREAEALAADPERAWPAAGRLLAALAHVSDHAGSLLDR